MNKIEIQTAFNLPNNRAMDYFLNKKVVPSAKMAEIGQSAHAKAFTLANINHLNVLQDFKKSLDDALKKGQGFGEWKKNLLDTAQKKGWMNHGDIFDPDTGQVIPPHRLATIFHTNMNGAFQAARYQSQLENAIYQPYWEYQAVGDSQTRPSHLALSGTIKKYDDPFWQVYYPPIAFRCRCTVIARSDYYLETNNKTISDIELETDINGNQYVKPQFGEKVYPDKGFSYKHGRHGFRPNLDDYDPKLAHEFAKQDMKSPEFLNQYKRLEKEYLKERNKLGLPDTDKIPKESLDQIRNKRRDRINFTAGVIQTDEFKPVYQSKTVWLSDDTIIKQFNSRLGDANINPDFYSLMPDVIARPDYVFNTAGKLLFIKKHGEKWLRLATKAVGKNEIYAESVYLIDEKELNKQIRLYKK